MKNKFLLEKEEEDYIEIKYLEMQKRNNTHEGIINLHASVTNEAYETLKDSTKRAKHLLQLLNLNVEDFQMPQDLIEYIMEIREEIESSETHQEIEEKLSNVSLEIIECSIKLDEHFSLAFKGETKVQDLILSFMTFNCLNEIIKKYKKNKHEKLQSI